MILLQLLVFFTMLLCERDVEALWEARGMSVDRREVLTNMRKFSIYETMRCQSFAFFFSTSSWSLQLERNLILAARCPIKMSRVCLQLSFSPKRASTIIHCLQFSTVLAWLAGGVRVTETAAVLTTRGKTFKRFTVTIATSLTKKKSINVLPFKH